MEEGAIRSKMDSALAALQNDIASVRTGRASAALVENIEVSAYGGAQRLKVRELASISTPDPQMLVLEPWDKSIIGDIRKGILASNAGLNPSIDGEVIRIAIAPMTSEDREKFVKLLHVKLENARVAIRQIRGDEMKDLKKQFEEKQLSEDERFSFEKKLQELTDEYVNKIDTIGKSKEEELRKI